MPLLFEQLPDEPAADYAALLQFRDLGPGRSISQAVAVTSLSESTLRRLAKRWDWATRLKAYDAASLERIAAISAQESEERHRIQLIEFREAQHRRAELIATAAEQLLELAVASVRAHLASGTLLQPGQLGAAMTAAARAIEASGSTAAAALGIDELLTELLTSEDRK